MKLVEVVKLATRNPYTEIKVERYNSTTFNTVLFNGNRNILYHQLITKGEKLYKLADKEVRTISVGEYELIIELEH